MAAYVIDDGPVALRSSHLEFGGALSKEYDRAPPRIVTFSPTSGGSRSSSSSEPESPKSVLPPRAASLGRKSARASHQQGGYWQARLAANLEAAKRASTKDQTTTPNGSAEAEPGGPSRYDQLMQTVCGEGRKDEKSFPDYSAQFAEAQKMRRAGRTAPIVPFSHGFGQAASPKELPELAPPPATQVAQKEPWMAAKVPGAEGIAGSPKLTPKRMAAASPPESSRGSPSRHGAQQAPRSPPRPASKARGGSLGAIFACFGGPK